MPRPPHISTATARVGASVFSPVAGRVAELQARGVELFPLHVGDTWLEPPPGCAAHELAPAGQPSLHRYVPDTRGLAPLLDALTERTREVHRLPYERCDLLVTAGSTLGLGNALSSLLEPNEEVLVLAPYWPLIRGIVHAQGGLARDVPFYDRVSSADEAVAAVEAARTPATVALYLSTPSNPTGRILPEDWLAALADWARRHNLWLVSDETYDQLVYRGEHASIARFAPERTLTCFSFSKSYGLAGYRVGYLVGPTAQVAAAHKLAVHSGYSAPTPSQLAAWRALRDGSRWLERARGIYQDAGRKAALELGLPEPEGSTFLFVDVQHRLDERGLDGFLLDCLEDGIQVAPGAACGHAYGGFIRLCYTSVAPDRVAEAVRRLRARLQ